MRVTGGEKKGTPIKAPAGVRTRPTSDKVREAMFSVLGDVSGARVLDLFAGSGALAIEALSRGAESAVIVEKESAAIGVIRLNTEKAGLTAEVRIVRIDFRSALRKLDRDGETFDLILIDPPYEGDLLDEAAACLTEREVASANCTIVVEHFKKTTPPISICGIPLWKTRDYGQTSLSFYQGPG